MGDGLRATLRGNRRDPSGRHRLLEPSQVFGQRPAVPLIVCGLVVGVLLGLLLGWRVWPVQWYDTDPSDLRLQHQVAYVTLVSDSLAVTGDIEAARQRLAELTDGDTTWHQVANLVEMVALNDFNEAREAVNQAYEMSADPDVMAVLGGWSPEAAAAAAPVYDRLELAFVAPPAAWSAAGFPSTGPIDEAFAARYQALSGGVPPGPAAAWAYAEAQRLLNAIDAAMGDGGEGARQRVGALLRDG